MTIGILSDTHDNLPRIDEAVGLFNRSRVGFVIHAGDFVAPFTIDRLKKLSCGWTGVFGNNDGEREGLSLKSEGRIKPPPLRLVLEGRRITVVHDRAGLDFASEKADLIVYGHSHKPDVSHSGSTLVVNPGECSGWLSGHSTVAFVDLADMKAQIKELP